MRFYSAALFGCLLLSGCGEEINRSKADKVAQVALESYSKSHGLEISKFSPPTVEEWESKGWYYKYVYPGPPRQEVSVLVEKNGNTQLSFSVD